MVSRKCEFLLNFSACHPPDPASVTPCWGILRFPHSPRREAESTCWMRLIWSERRAQKISVSAVTALYTKKSLTSFKNSSVFSLRTVVGSSYWSLGRPEWRPMAMRSVIPDIYKKSGLSENQQALISRCECLRRGFITKTREQRC